MALIVKGFLSGVDAWTINTGASKKKARSESVGAALTCGGKEQWVS